MTVTMLLVVLWIVEVVQETPWKLHTVREIEHTRYLARIPDRTVQPG